MTSGTAVPREREDWLDWLRGLAAFAVVIFHFNQIRTHDGGWYDRITSYGWLGVPVFFFVSGYCIYLALQRTRSWQEFLGRRLSRIYPPYVASLALIAAEVLWRRAIRGSNDITALPKTVPDIFATLLLLIDPVTHVPPMNWVYWTLTYEVAFYFVITLTLLRKQNYETVLLITTFTSIFPFLHAFTPMFFLKYWGLFSLGIAMARGVQDRRGSIPILALSGVSIVMNLDRPIGLTALVVFALGCVRWLKSPDFLCGPLKNLGKISYSLYLIHVPLGIYGFSHVFHINPRGTMVRVVAVDFALVCCCAAAASVFWYYVERPSIDFGRRRFGRKDNQSPIVEVAR